MISKTDLILLLTELEDSGVDVKPQLHKTITSTSIPFDVVRFINDNRQLDLTTFYERLRKNYNHKKSKLYMSIIKDIEDPTEVITTLSSYNLQVALFAKQLEDNQLFLKHSRAKEVNMVLTQYYTNYDLTNCLNLLRLIKADLMACEIITGRRKES